MPAAREDLFAEPAVWARTVARFPRMLLREERADLQAGFLPPEAVDRNLGRLRALLAGGAPTLILCDNAGKLYGLL